MPQLDLTIIFPQIFWLFILFSGFYFILTFYLLPKFLVSLKIRQYILDENLRKINGRQFLENNTKNLQLKNSIDKLNSNFEKINLILISKTSNKTTKINFKFLVATLQTFLFCDSIVFKNIIFYPKKLWNKNF
nr:ATP synthase F0 subunit 8 [Ceramothamnion sp.]